MTLYLLVGLGSLLGGSARVAVSWLCAGWSQGPWPWDLFAVNVTGSFAIGLFATLCAADGRYPASPGLQQFVIAGVCGGFTTFSVFSLESVDMFQAGQAALAVSHVMASLVAWLLAAWAGVAIASRLNRRDRAGGQTG
ncbi:MAG: CrcB family protein [Gammaproteobacteria bacterium]|nr:CrcB family protein [Gammaproteobacteria bacterium]